MTFLAKIGRRKPADLLMAAEALALLALFRICLALIPVRRIVSVITHGNSGVQPNRDTEARDAVPISEPELQIARRVQWAVKAVARHSVVEFVCFPQTLAAYVILRWRKVPSTIVYGVARSAEGNLIAHTWLEVGDGYVTGGEEAGGFTPIDRWM